MSLEGKQPHFLKLCLIKMTSTMIRVKVNPRVLWDSVTCTFSFKLPGKPIKAIVKLIP